MFVQLAAATAAAWKLASDKSSVYSWTLSLDALWYSTETWVLDCLRDDGVEEEGAFTAVKLELKSESTVEIAPGVAADESVLVAVGVAPL